MSDERDARKGRNRALHWMRVLREHADLGGVARTLAMAVGHLGGASRVGVFLLDESKTHLLLVASWS